MPREAIVTIFVLNVAGLATTTYLLLQYFVRRREQAMRELDEKHRELEVEQARSERLLLNVLPPAIARRLKEGEEVIAESSSASG